MNAHWRKQFIKLTVALVADILLNLNGLDELADYSEFIFEHQDDPQISQVVFTVHSIANAV